MTLPKVEAQHLTKQFKIYRRASGRLWEWLSLGKRNCHGVFTALDDREDERAQPDE